MVIGFCVVQWETNAFVKSVVVTLASLVATLVLCDIGVRRAEPLTRFLLGTRPERS